MGKPVLDGDRARRLFKAEGKQIDALRRALILMSYAHRTKRDDWFTEHEKLAQEALATIDEAVDCLMNGDYAGAEQALGADWNWKD
jgi:hypothetical protein